MPDTVTEISGSAFAGCDMIEEIILPPKLTKIPDVMFWGNDSLKKVTIQENVEVIEDDAFFLCDNLKDIYYTGTRQQWSKISIGESNDCLHKATIHFKD